MRLITNTFAYCTRELPKWNTISISGYHIREAGATAPQEIAFTLADAIAYVDAAVSLGLPVDDFARRISFFFSSGSDLLEEVAKFRAVRRMWAHIMRDRYGATTRESRALRFHAQTSGAMLTAQQPDNNVVRVTLHALAAVLGGAQSLHTNSRDEALSLPTEESVQIALRTQQILALESGVGNTIDPLGGSWAVETLTDEIEAQAQAYLDTIAAAGGMVTAIENGYPQREIEDAAYQYQREIEEKKRLVVGLNSHTREASNACFDVLQQDPQVHRSQVARLHALRERRDNAAVTGKLALLREAAENQDGDLMEPILACVRQYATLGEISQVLRDTFGEHRQHIGM
jgi:methylmalonyl-CoA mutase N-terminal domain/subunit